jgi:hypothetical protein
MQQAYPADPDALTAEWLTERLRAAGVLGPDGRVVSIAMAPLGEGVGFMGRLARVSLTYDGEAPGAPRSLVAKFAAAPGEHRQIAMSFRLYEREVRFYQEVAPALPGAVAPGCFAAELDRASGDSVLLLEDLCDYRMGDQLEGCSEREAELVIDALAPMHARYWGGQGLAWAPRIDGPIQIEGATAGCQAGWDPCAARFGRAIAPEILERRDQFLAAVPVLHQWMARPTQTLIHGDIRLDNLMFGAGPGLRPVVALDWIVTFSAGAQDLAYLLSQNLTTLERRRGERRLIARYQARLAELGVADYTPEQAWADYQLAILFVFNYAVLIAGTLDPANARGARMMERLVSRASAAVMDHGLIARLPG